MTSGPHRLDARPSQVLPRGLSLTDDLLRIAVIAGDLVNTRSVTRGMDYLLDTDALAYTVSDHPWPLPPVQDSDLEPVLRLRDRLDRVFRQSAYDELDLLLLEHPPVLALAPVEEGGTPRLLIGAATPALSAVLTAQLALSLSVFLADASAGSLDACDASDCDNVAVRRGAGPSVCSDRCRSFAADHPAPPGRPARARTSPRSGRSSRR
jgi:hypothetical protein